MRWGLAALALVVSVWPVSVALARPDEQAAVETYMHDVATGVARYAPDGAPDRTFNVTGLLAVRGADQAFSNALVVQPDERIVVVGGATDVSSGVAGFGISRYNADGTADTTFASGGTTLTRVAGHDAQAYAVSLQPDAKIVVAGTVFGTSTEHDQIGVVRYNPDGSLDDNFGTGGVTTVQVGAGSAEARGLALQADSKIIVAGTAFANGPTDDDFALVRFNSDGTLDDGFGSRGLVTTDFGGVAGAADSLAPLDRANAVAIQSDGRIVAVGATRGRTADFAVARYNADGSLDPTFGSNGRTIAPIGADAEAFAVAIQSDGGIVVAGGTASANSGTPFAVARFRSDGTLDSTFGSVGFVTATFEGGSSGARAVAIQPDGMVLAAGGGYGPASIGDDDVQNGGFALVRYCIDGTPDV